MGNPTASRRGERGFTLIEVMIAATVLVVGVLSTFKLVDGANTVNSLNGARLGAQGLEREIVEYARGTDYDSLQPSQLVDVLRQRSSLAGAASPWTIRRRGVAYTVTASVCTFDDPKDGLASTPPANACPAAAADPTAVNGDGTAKVDQNPDDFRRVTIKLDWRVRARTGTMTQSALIVNPAGALGPRILDPFWDTSGVEFGPGTSHIDWSVVNAVTTQPASGVHWSADDRTSGGDATGGPTSWTFTWQLGTEKLTPLTIDNTWVPDGNYVLSVQGVDSRGVPGEARTTVVHINRHAPAAVAGAAGGFNARHGGVVDMHWQAYPERDALGYRVYRDGLDASNLGQLVCPSDGSAYSIAKTCTDTNPGASGSTHHYQVYAMDCSHLVGTCTPRLGTAFDIPVTLSAGTALPAPTGLSATISQDLPTLMWTPVPNARFYRIYRDNGTGLSGRYDETISSDSTYTDPHPGDSMVHTYWVTAVDSNFNESPASAPVTSPGP